MIFAAAVCVLRRISRAVKWNMLLDIVNSVVFMFRVMGMLILFVSVLSVSGLRSKLMLSYVR